MSSGIFWLSGHRLSIATMNIRLTPKYSPLVLSLETDVIYGGIPTVFTLWMSFCDLFLENAEIGWNFSLAFCLLLLVALGIEDK